MVSIKLFLQNVNLGIRLFIMRAKLMVVGGCFFELALV